MDTNNGRRPLATAFVIGAIATLFAIVPATAVAATYTAPSTVAADSTPAPDTDAPGTCGAADPATPSAPSVPSALVDSGQRTPTPDHLRSHPYPH